MDPSTVGPNITKQMMDQGAELQMRVGDGFEKRPLEKTTKQTPSARPVRRRTPSITVSAPRGKSWS
eukprot:15449575-Alexandrium_andersonii.AAC.1